VTNLKKSTIQEVSTILMLMLLKNVTHLHLVICQVITVVFPKEGQVTRHVSFLRYPSRSENKLFLWSDAQNISDLFDLEACPASLIWPSFGNTTVRERLADLRIHDPDRDGSGEILRCTAHRRDGICRSGNLRISGVAGAIAREGWWCEEG
jgi:hypothetical protein